jgi:dienelactone hydrolase
MNKIWIFSILAGVVAVTVIVQTMHHNKEMGTHMKKETEAFFEFPALTGPYDVGTIDVHVIDPKRKDIYDLNAPRELMVKVWYPATKNTSKKLEVYYERGLSQIKQILKQQGFPEQDIMSVDHVYIHAITNALPLHTEQPFPLILFSHGYLGCEAEIYTVFCEELASHGYIVGSIAHTHYANMVTFPDNRNVTCNPEKLKQQSMPTEQEKQLWLHDVQSALDHMIQINNDEKSILYQLINTHRLGIIGHSMGGWAAFDACLHDARFKAGIALDSIPEKDVTALKKPFLFIYAQETIDNLYASDEALAKKLNIPIEQITAMRASNEQMSANEKLQYNNIITSTSIPSLAIPGITHMGFSDLMIEKEMPLFKNNKHILNMDTAIGSADGFATIALINKAIVAFFEQNL